MLKSAQHNPVQSKALFPWLARWKRAAALTVPWFTMTITLCSVLLSLTPDVLMDFCFDSEAIEQGEWWRLITGHLVHSSFDHLWWDALAFLCVGCYLEVKSLKLLLIALLSGFVTVNGLLLSPWSPLLYYCGLSGLLFAPLTLALWMHWQCKKGLLAILPMLVCIVKVVWECSQQSTLLVTSGWPAYPQAHLAGIVGGVLACFISYRVMSGNCRQRYR